VTDTRDVTPYAEFDRETWSALRASTPLELTDADLARLRGLGEHIDLDEVAAIYLPLTRLLNLYVTASAGLRTATDTFLGGDDGRVPYVIGIAGSVAVGKSTTARLLQTLLASWSDHPNVALVTTDGFLLPNAELERRDLMNRKGFPESYDQRALLRFMAAVKSGADRVYAPVYSHLVYDVVQGETVEVARPDILILEGLNVLQPARVRADGRAGLAVSDFFDFGLYVDAKTEDVKSWYVERFLALRRTAFADPASFFHRFATLTDREAVELAGEIWDTINEPNLRENIRPTRGRATLILRKARDHSVQRVSLRKL
jgi:type I pantothenate kinase